MCHEAKIARCLVLAAAGLVGAAATSPDCRGSRRPEEPPRRVAAASAGAREVLDHALREARGVEVPADRTLALVAVAEGRAKAGDRVAAREALREAREAAMHVPKDKPGRKEGESPVAYRCSLLAQISVAQARVCDLAAARETADAILENAPDGITRLEWIEGDRERCLGEIAAGLAREGRLDEALELAGGLEQRNQADRARDRIAADRVEAGDLEAARRAADGIRDVDIKGGAQAAAALARAKAEGLEAARADVDAIQSPEARARALASLARLQRRAGRLSEAEATFAAARKAIDDLGGAAGGRDLELKRGSLLFHLAGELKEAGDIANALRTAEAFPDYEDYPFRRRFLPPYKAGAGDIEGAIEIIRTIPRVVFGIEGRDQALALVDVSQALAQGGDVPGALRVAGRIEDEYQRAVALTAIGRAQMKSGDAPGAARTFKEARTRAVRCTEPTNISLWKVRPDLMRGLAAAEAEAGREAEIRSWIGHLAAPNERALALVGLADGLAARGRAGREPAGEDEESSRAAAGHARRARSRAVSLPR